MSGVRVPPPRSINNLNTLWASWQSVRGLFHVAHVAKCSRLISTVATKQRQLHATCVRHRERFLGTKKRPARSWPGHFSGFHSRASRCASAICSRVIRLGNMRLARAFSLGINLASRKSDEHVADSIIASPMGRSSLQGAGRSIFASQIIKKCIAADSGQTVLWGYARCRADNQPITDCQNGDEANPEQWLVKHAV